MGIFNSTSTYGDYVSMMGNFCCFHRFPAKWTTACGRHVERGLWGSQERICRCPNFTEAAQGRVAFFQSSDRGALRGAGLPRCSWGHLFAEEEEEGDGEEEISYRREGGGGILNRADGPTQELGVRLYSSPPLLPLAVNIHRRFDLPGTVICEEHSPRGCACPTPVFGAKSPLS